MQHAEHSTKMQDSMVSLADGMACMNHLLRHVAPHHHARHMACLVTCCMLSAAQHLEEHQFRRRQAAYILAEKQPAQRAVHCSCACSTTC